MARHRTLITYLGGWFFAIGPVLRIPSGYRSETFHWTPTVQRTVAGLLLTFFLLLAIEGGEGVASLLLVLTRMAAFLSLAVVLAMRLIPRLGALVEKLPVSEGILSFALVVALLYALAAEALGGMAAITGAFLAGLFFARTSMRTTIETKMHGLTHGWLVTVFS